VFLIGTAESVSEECPPALKELEASPHWWVDDEDIDAAIKVQRMRNIFAIVNNINILAPRFRSCIKTENPFKHHLKLLINK
jgi:hypothetical protein